MKNQKVIMITLGVLLAIAIIFIVATQIRSYNIQKNLEQQQTQVAVYKQGAQEGYQAAIRQLMEQAATCNTVPIYADNVSMNIVAVECLQQQAPQEAAE